MLSRAIASRFSRSGRVPVARPPASDWIWIRALCRDCGEVRFESFSARVHVEADSGTNHMSFLCPKCGVRSVRRLPPSVVEQLRQAGVAVRLLTRPAEADELHNGPPLDDLDAADFVRLLGRPGWEAHLSGGPRWESLGGGADSR
jgi:hypothetical protein